MPNARPWCRGQAPQPRSGAPKAQGLTAATAVAVPSLVPSFALKSTGVDWSIGTSATPGIYTSLTDVTWAGGGEAVSPAARSLADNHLARRQQHAANLAVCPMAGPPGP